MFGAVIHICAPDVLHQRREKDIQDEDDQPDHAFEEIQADIHADRALTFLRDKRLHAVAAKQRQKDEQSHRERDAEQNGDEHDHAVNVHLERLGEPFFEFGRFALFVAEDLSAAHERLYTRDHGAEKVEHAADDRYAEENVFVLGGLDVTALDGDPALFEAHGGGDAALAAHHHSLDDCLSAYLTASLSHIDLIIIRARI